MRSLSSLLSERGRTGPLNTNPRYGRIFFALRRHFELSATECLLIDVINILSRKSGWCFASRDYLAGLLGVSTRTLQRMLAALKERGLIEEHPHDVRRLRPTQTWRKAWEVVTR